MRRIALHVPWPWTGEETRDLLRFTFLVALFSLVAGIMLEQLDHGFLSTYLNIDDLAVTVFILGVVSAMWPVRTVSAVLSWRSLTFAVLAAIILVVWIRHELNFLVTMKQALIALSVLSIGVVGVASWFEHNE